MKNLKPVQVVTILQLNKVSHFNGYGGSRLFKLKVTDEFEHLSLINLVNQCTSTSCMFVD